MQALDDLEMSFESWLKGQNAEQAPVWQNCVQIYTFQQTMKDLASNNLIARVIPPPPLSVNGSKKTKRWWQF
jgi:hypothetical protein